MYHQTFVHNCHFHLHIISIVMSTSVAPALICADAVLTSDEKSSVDCCQPHLNANSKKKRPATDQPEGSPARKRQCGKNIPYSKTILFDDEEDGPDVQHQLLDPRLMPSTRGIIFVCPDPRFYSKRDFAHRIADWTSHQCENYLKEDNCVGIDWAVAHGDSGDLEEILEMDPEDTNFLFVHVQVSAERWLTSTFELMAKYSDKPNTYALIPEHLMTDHRHLRYENRPNIPGFYDLPSARDAAFRTSTFPYGETEWSCIPLQSIKHYFLDGEYTEEQNLELQNHWSLLVDAYANIAIKDPIFHERISYDIGNPISEANQMYADLVDFASRHPQFKKDMPKFIE